MVSLAHKFTPTTRTSRRETPGVYEHLRKYVEPVGKNIELTSITQITDINNQLEQFNNFYASNIIERVIAQIIGATTSGFVTIKGTDDGALHVHEVGGTTLEIKQAAITFAASGDNDVIAAVAGKKLKITDLTWTVADDTDITLKSGTTAITGAMAFGGTDEPRGIVSNFTNPLATAAGEKFVMHSSAAVQVSGLVIYYEE